MFAAWLEEGPTDIPAHVLDAALAEARSMPQPRDWLGPLRRYLPMDATVSAPARAGRPPIGAFAVVALLLLALAVAAFLVGTQRRLPPPSGLARNGAIAFDSQGDIFTAQADGSGRQQLTSGPAVDTSPSWSPDGTRVAFWSRPDAFGPRDLVVIDSEGSRPKVIARRAGSPDTPGGMIDVAWAPDSAQVAFVDARKQLHVARVDGSSDVIVGGDGLQRDEPAWSPDGRLIAFRGVGGDGQAGLYVIRPDGSSERRLSTSAGGGYAFTGSQWSPDGTRLAYYFGEDGAHDIGVIDVGADREAIVSSNPFDEYWPLWSPDGARVMFQRTQSLVVGSDAEVSVRPDGTDESVVVNELPHVGGAIFLSPDGRLAFGFAGEPADQKVAVFPLDGSVQPVLIDATNNAGVGVGSWQRLVP
jgi:Tol biopolymer transport system component